MDLELYDTLRDRIAREGLTAQMQTRIAMYLTGIRSATIPALACAWTMPKYNLTAQAFGSQFFRESEAVALILQATKWSSDPTAQFQTALACQPVMLSVGQAMMYAPHNGLRAAVHLLALEHALLATVRLAPILPNSSVMEEPFAACLLRIEQENGRQLQTQIRVLKDGFEDISISEKEEIVAREGAVAKQSFLSFLRFLASS